VTGGSFVMLFKIQSLRQLDDNALFNDLHTGAGMFVYLQPVLRAEYPTFFAYPFCTTGILPSPSDLPGSMFFAPAGIGAVTGASSGHLVQCMQPIRPHKANNKMPHGPCITVSLRDGPAYATGAVRHRMRSNSRLANVSMFISFSTIVAAPAARACSKSKGRTMPDTRIRCSSG
jgi:hypothetical protein